MSEKEHDDYAVSELMCMGGQKDNNVIVCVCV